MKRRLFAIVMLLCVAQVASAGMIITGLTRYNPDSNSGDTDPMIAGPLAEDSLTFVDRDHEYNEIPAYLIGADYVMVANDDKDNPNLEYDLTVAGSVTLYLIIDNRVGDDVSEDGPVIGSGKMDWVVQMGFVDTGDSIGIDEGGDGDIDQYSRLYKLENASGTLRLFAQDDGGSRNNYGIAAVPEPASIALLGLGAVLLRRKRS